MRLFFLFLLTISSAWSKSFETRGMVTFFNLTGKVSPYGSLTFYHYDIFTFESKKFGGKTYRAGDNQTYFQFAYNYQFLPDLQASLGYIFQRSEPFRDNFLNEDRLFQQIVFAKRLRALTLSHRFRFEERFIDNRAKKDWELRTRLRYQIGGKIPLRGLTIDPGEFFLNTYNEFYFSTTGERNAFWSDNWFYFGLGFQTKTLGTFEAGPLIQVSVVDRDKNLRYHETIMAGWNYVF